MIIPDKYEIITSTTQLPTCFLVCLFKERNNYVCTCTNVWSRKTLNTQHLKYKYGNDVVLTYLSIDKLENIVIASKSSQKLVIIRENKVAKNKQFRAKNKQFRAKNKQFPAYHGSLNRWYLKK